MYTVRKICKFYGSVWPKFVRVTSVILIYGEAAYIGYWRIRSSAHSSTWENFGLDSGPFFVRCCYDHEDARGKWYLSF